MSRNYEPQRTPSENARLILADTAENGGTASQYVWPATPEEVVARTLANINQIAQNGQSGLTPDVQAAIDASQAAAIAASLQKGANLSDLANASTSRTNLGLGTLATQSTITASQVSDSGAAGRLVVQSSTPADVRNAAGATAGVFPTSAVPTLTDLGGTPTSRTITASGLATGGGSMAADRTITVTAATLADARAGTSSSLAMTPSVARTAFLGNFFYANPSGSSTGTVGSGSVTTTGNVFGPNTGGTAGSSANMQWLMSVQQGASWTRVDFSRPQSFAIRFVVGNSPGTTANGLFRAHLGTHNAGSLNAAGFGFELRGSRIWLVAHNGSSLSQQDTGVNVAGPFVANRFRCECSGGIVSLWSDGVQVGSNLSGGPNTSADGLACLYNANNADASANDIRIINGSFIIWTY